MNKNPSRVFLIIVLLLIHAANAAAQTAQSSIPPTAAAKTQRAECFAFETLPAVQRQRAEELLLKALDSEALYTIAGGIKPMSSGFQQFRVAVQAARVESAEAEKTIGELGTKKAEELKDPEKASLSRARAAVEQRDALTEIENTRQILTKWRCGAGDEIFADVQHFANPYDGKRFLDTVVFARSALRRMLIEKQSFFSRWGITENSHPLEVLYAVETNETSARNAGYGYLFGYPDAAVRFFFEAANEEDLTGKFITRDFYSIPTFARQTNGFVYAVPKNYGETETDRNLKARAAAILASYKRRRAEYIGANKKGAVEMLRDWFCAANEDCSPSNAR